MDNMSTLNKGVTKIKDLNRQIEELKVTYEKETEELRKLLEQKKLAFEKEKAKIEEKINNLKGALLDSLGEDIKPVIKLPAGTIRINKKVVLKQPENVVIEALREVSLYKKCVRIKETVNKTEIKKLPESKLKKLTHVIEFETTVSVT